MLIRFIQYVKSINAQNAILWNKYHTNYTISSSNNYIIPYTITAYKFKSYKSLKVSTDIGVLNLKQPSNLSQSIFSL